MTASHPLTGLLSLAAEYEIRLPAYLLFQAYTAWQAARVPVWSATDGRFRLRFSWSRFRAGWGAALRALLPWKRRTFHVVRPPAECPAGRPEVLHVIPSLLLGGSQKVLFDLYQHLGSTYRMRILTGWLPHWGRYEGLDVSVCRDAEAMAANLKARPPDLIHLHFLGLERFTAAFLRALELAPEIQAPLVENINMPDPALVHPRVGHYVYVSEFARSIQPVRTGPDAVIYPGVAAEEWPARGPRPSGEPPTAGLVYRLATEKLAPDSIEPFLALARRMPEARCLIVGEGLYLPHYVRRTVEEKVRSQFHFAGRIPYRELPAWYERMDLFLAPVHSESYGVVVPYALFKGVPVLTYRVGALPEILGEGDHFCANAEEMARRAEALLRDPPAAQRLAGAQHARAGRSSIEAMVNSYASVYGSLLPPKKQDS